MFEQLERKPWVIPQRFAVLGFWTTVGCAFLLGILVGIALITPKSPDWPLDILNLAMLSYLLLLGGNSVARRLRERTPEGH